MDCYREACKHKDTDAAPLLLTRSRQERDCRGLIKADNGRSGAGEGKAHPSPAFKLNFDYFCRGEKLEFFPFLRVWKGTGVWNRQVGREYRGKFEKKFRK